MISLEEHRRYRQVAQRSSLIRYRADQLSETDRIGAPRSHLVLVADRREGAPEHGREPGYRIGDKPDAPLSARRSDPKARTVARVGLTAFLIAGLLLILVLPEAGADRGQAPTVSYVVRPGDTLWSIAAAYTPAGGDVRATVRAIRAIRERSSAVIVVGELIEIPVGEAGTQLPGKPAA